MHGGYDWIPSEGGYDPSGFEAYEDDPQDEQGGTNPQSQSQPNPNPPLGPLGEWAGTGGGMSNSPHKSFNTANEGGLNSPPPVFASRLYNPRDSRRATLDLPDDLSSALTLEPDSRALRGSVEIEKLKGRVRFLETVLTEWDTANASSFAAMRAELDDMWESVHGANLLAAEGLALGNEALSDSPILYLYGNKGIS